MDSAYPMEAVREYISAFNKGDTNAMAASFTAPGLILDVSVDEPLHSNATGDSAYVVVPASMTLKVHGQQVTQKGAIFTVALRKLAEGWRIAAWSWATGIIKRA